MRLKLWSRDKNKVMVLQHELNAAYPHDLPKLKIDGKFGLKTQAKVLKFQRSIRNLKADGVFGPITLKEFRLKYPTTKLAVGTSIKMPEMVITANAKKISKFQDDFEKVFKQQNKKKEWQEFTQFVDSGMKNHSYVKTVITGIRTAENARMFAAAFLTMKSWGFTGKQILTVCRQLAKLNGSHFMLTLKALSEPAGRFGSALKSLGGTATIAILLCDFIECLYHASKGNYAAIFGIIYKVGARVAFPRLAMLNCLQAFLNGIFPNSPKLNIIFRILKAFDPIGLGSVGVESMTATATALYHWGEKGDAGAMIPRLDKLVKRLKKSPAGVLAELGDNAGRSAYQLSRMSSNEWGVIMSLNWRRFKSIFSN